MERLSSSAAATAATSIVRPSLFYPSTKKRNGGLRLRANLNYNHDQNHSLFQNAVTRASIRFQETNRPEPLFIDPYAGCFVPPNFEMDMKYHQQQYQYCLATRFIDDQLLSITKNIDGVKQVVLLTDGMDTRPYRLNWPLSTIIYDISPEPVFRTALQKLQDVQAKIPRSSLLYHVPLESSNKEQLMRNKGFTGNRPSIWALQGMPVTDLTSFEEILFMISSLAMKGCFFVGELPEFMMETETGMKSTTRKRMEKLFMNYGFRVDIISYEEVARNLSKEPALGDYNSVIFNAEHLRFSDDQMETWRREIQRVEEEGDEESFEDL